MKDKVIFSRLKYILLILFILVNSFISSQISSKLNVSFWQNILISFIVALPFIAILWFVEKKAK